MRTDRRGRRDRENEKSADSPLSVGSFKRVPTVQRLEDMELHGGDNNNSNNSGNNGSNSRGKDSNRFGSNSSYSDHSSRGTSQSQPLFRSNAKLSSPEKPDGSLSGRTKGTMSYQSSSARDENDWDRSPGIAKGVFSSSSSSNSTGRATSSTYSTEQEHTHTRLPHTALGNSTYPLTTPAKSSSSGTSKGSGAGAGAQSSLAPSMGATPVSTKARYRDRAVPLLSSHFISSHHSSHLISE